MVSSQEERRASVRHNVDLPARIAGSPVRVTSLSRIGAFVEGAHDLAVGAPVQLVLLGREDAAPVEIRGQVIRRLIRNPRRCDLGIMFAPCSRETEAGIESLIGAP